MAKSCMIFAAPQFFDSFRDANTSLQDIYTFYMKHKIYVFVQVLSK